MKGNFVLILSLLVLGAYTSSITNLITKFVKTNQHSAKFISHLLEVQNQLSTSTAGFEEIYEALQAVRDYLNQQKQNAISDYQSKYTLHQNLISSYNSQIDSARSDYTSSRSLLDNQLYPKRDSLNTAINQANSNLVNLAKDETTLIANREKEVADYQSNEESLVNAVAACDEALAHLRSLKNGEASGAFLQMNAKSGKVFINMLENKLMKAWERSHKKDKFSFHMIKSLAQAATAQNFADQDVLAKAISLVEQLKERFQSEKGTAQQREAENKKAFENNLERIKGQITSNQNDLDLANIELKSVNEKISENENIYTTRKADFDSATKNKQSEIESWDLYEKSHNDNVDQLDKELAIVQDTENALRNSGNA